ncbi:MAG: ribonuclease III domain-containing protein [Lachnospiraceae bacterium]|nr:ribonuclease III domain-containing protein [Lachnospiraceae bacterium]NLZ69694.1 ribonuclease III [Spirochaetales bacterium]
MEESLSLLMKLKKEFQCTEVDIKTYSPLTLAYIGDSIYDLIIRTVIVERGNRAANGLHKSTSKIVNAGTQAAMAESLSKDLTENEMAVYKRGRNAKSYTSAKNATIGDYRKATGFEALMGYLYLTDNLDRAIDLIKTALEKIAMEI